MLFLLTARSLEIKVEAQAKPTLSISGLAIPFGQRFLLRPGNYDVQVGAPGYHSQTLSVLVDKSDVQSLEVELKPLPGLLSLVSNPSNATVFIDGEKVGETPLNALEVEPGAHELRLELARYLDHSQAIDVVGRSTKQAIAQDLEPAWANISVDSIPSGAQVIVEGVPLAQTPAVIAVLQGEAQLTLQLAAYADWQRTITVVAGEAQDLGTVSLPAAPGQLSVDSAPTGANVTLDGEFQGQTPLVLQLSPERMHRIALFKPGYQRYSVEWTLQADETAQRTFELKPRLGEVQLAIAPSKASIKVNGKFIGKGSQTLTLPAVEHVIEISFDGHVSQRHRVTPRPGLSQRVAVTLLTPEKARVAGVKPEITTALGQTLLLFKPDESDIPAFTMGASRREPGRRANEVLRPVVLRRMFYLQTTEVSNAAFRRFQANHESGQVEGQSLNREHQPAVDLSWQQAASFCNWLSRKEGLEIFYKEQDGIIIGHNPKSLGYRLPTEAEWAWAARANGSTLLKFPWGDNFPPTKAVENYADTSSAYVTGRVINNYDDGFVTSAPVASFATNRLGLYDMGGNVAEWVHDVYAIAAQNSASQTDPLGASTGDNYVIRGASWSQAKLVELRLSHRDYGYAGRDDVGFRIARYAE